MNLNYPYSVLPFGIHKARPKEDTARNMTILKSSSALWDYGYEIEMLTLRRISHHPSMGTSQNTMTNENFLFLFDV